MAPKILILAGAMALTGCAVGPDYSQPQPKMPESFAALSEASIGAVDRRWWGGFGDPILDSLVQRALDGGYSVKLAGNRLLEARAVLGLNSAEYYPSAELFAEYERGRRSSDLVLPGQNRRVEFYGAGVLVSWEIDIFGRTSRAVEAAEAMLGGADAALRDAQVLLISEVARTYLVLRGTQARLDIAQRSARAQRETLQLVQARLEVGRGNAFDVARAQSQVDSTSASIPMLRSQTAAAVHRLSVLVGSAPATLRGELAGHAAMPHTPSLGGLGRPEDLLRRRPDLRVAERRLAAATASIGIATADLYPSLSIVGSAGYLSPSSSGLGKSEASNYSILPGIRWGILDFQRIRARIDVANVQAAAALLELEQKILLALEETENALTNYGSQIQRRNFLRSNTQASQAAADLAMQRYRDGAASFLDVLDSERTLLLAQDQLAQTEQDASVALVLVYASLGGGWEEPQSEK